jgi:hypothetical protein
VLDRVDSFLRKRERITMGIRFVSWAVLAIVGIALAANGATVTVDGDLTDWGVDLQLAYTGNTVAGYPGSAFLPGSFAPSPGITYGLANDDVSLFSGGELSDVEALYCTHDETMVYFAVVTSSNPNGTRWDGYGDQRFGPGDLRLSVGDEVYCVGARPLDLTIYGLSSDINGPPDQRHSITWDSATDVAGDGTYYATSQARVERGAEWSHVNNPGDDSDGYFVGGTGEFVGYTAAAWKQKFVVGDYYINDPVGQDEPYGTWIFEVALSRSLLGMTGTGEIKQSAFALDCGNDVILLADTFVDSKIVASAPEPTMIIFFGTGVVGVLGFVVRRRCHH